jgi:hypothetical protein
MVGNVVEGKREREGEGEVKGGRKAWKKYRRWIESAEKSLRAVSRLQCPVQNSLSQGKVKKSDQLRLPPRIQDSTSTPRSNKPF